jgi:hypothetical protein
MRDYERERARELRWAAGNFERALRMMRRRNGLEAEEVSCCCRTWRSGTSTI